MDDGTRPQVVWPELVGVVAAASVGAVVAANGFTLALYATFTDVLVSGSVGSGVYAAALLAVAIAVPALLPRLPGWPVAVAGLAAFLVGDLLVPDLAAVLLPVGAGSTQQVAVALAGVVGLGLALGGVLLALAQASPSVSWLLAAGLAGGLVLHEPSVELIRAVLAGGTGQPASASVAAGSWARASGVQLWLALALVVAAAVVVRFRRRDDPDDPTRLRPGVPVAVLGGAALLLAGLAARMWALREFRLDPAASFHVFGAVRGQRGDASFALLSSVVLAVVLVLVLAQYAYRVGGVGAVRWVLLGGAAGPVLAIGFPNSGFPPASRTVSILLLGLLAVAGGALAARYAARLLPWDAFGLLVVAAAMAFTWPTEGARSADRLGALLLAVGLGFAVGSGIVLVTGPARDAGRSGVLALGMATAMLCATALAPVVLRFRLGALREVDRSFTASLYVAAGAVLLVLLFAFVRAVEGFGRDRPAEEPATRS